jgi:hypothetical protein
LIKLAAYHMAGTGPAAGGGRGRLGGSQARLIRIAGRN